MGTLVIKNTVRGGKTITHNDDIIILGDVYPTATVSAGGNIVIMGTAEGSLIAGTEKGTSAVIVVNRFHSPYIKIGHLYARQEPEETTGPNVIYVDKDKLIIKTIKVDKGGN